MSSMAQPGAALEKAELLAKLKAGEERFFTAATSVPAELCKVAPAEGAWSVLEIAEHVAIVESSLLSRMSSATPGDEPNRSMDAQIAARALDRDNRRQAPERAQPKGQYQSVEEALNAFQQNRRATLALLEEQAADLRWKKIALPFGTLDGYQLLLFAALHPERHAAQIEEIKRSAAYQAAQQRTAS